MVERPCLNVALVTSDPSLRNQLIASEHEGVYRFYFNIPAALAELQGLLRENEPANVLLALSLDELAGEPGNVQATLQRFCHDYGLAIFGGLTEDGFPNLIHPVVVDDIVRFPFVPEELLHRIRGHAKMLAIQDVASSAQALLAGVADALLGLDAQGRIVWANMEADFLFGQGDRKLVGHQLHGLLPPDLSSEISCAMKKPARSSARFSGRMHTERGSSACIECTVKTFDSPSLHAVVQLRDVTEQRAREAALQLSAKVFEYSGEAIMITDSEDRIMAVNDSFTKVTGYKSKEVVGRPPHFLSAGRQGNDFYRRMWDIVHRDGHWKGEVWNRRRNGEVYAEWLAVTAVRNDRGEVDHYISIFSDITERKIREEHIAHQAFHDFLTGLPNRVLLEDRFGQAKAVTQRDSLQLAVMFIDLDGFKAINDRLGHGVGDALLCAVAERLRSMVRTSDTVSRFGGDEFVCLLVELPEKQTALAIAEAVRTELMEPIMVAEHRLSLTASIGLAFFPDDGAELDILLRKADEAMYVAKRGGRNRYCAYGEAAQ